jgi:hypothetical protein
MEEILASIRRIIADDDAAKSAPGAASPAPNGEKGTPASSPPLLTPLGPASSARLGAAPSRPAPVTPDDIDALMTPSEPGAEKPASGVLDLTEAMAAAGAAGGNGFRTIDGQSDLVFEERAMEAGTPMPAADSRRPQDRPLMSGATTAAIDSAFNSLAQTVLVHNARTLEDLVREMLRPMLKSWLDDNLPGLVERLVRAEIERVSRGR